jgi:hypothetical protein
VVLESFRKTVADRRDTAIERPAESFRADEKGLLNVLLSDVAGRERLVADLEDIGILDRLATRRIYQAIAAVHAAGLPVAFSAVNDRLEDADRALLAGIIFSEDAGEGEMTLEYGEQCLESMRRSAGQLRRAQLKARVREAERSGDLTEALRLAQELQSLERSGGPQI